MTSTTTTRRPSRTARASQLASVPSPPETEPTTGAPATEPTTSAPETGGIKWEDPTGGTGSRTASDKYAREIAAMRANPGRWLVLLELTGVTTGTKGTENIGYRLGKAVSHGSLGFTPKGAFESTARKLPGDQMKVWARYVGETHVTDASTDAE